MLRRSREAGSVRAQLDTFWPRNGGGQHHKAFSRLQANILLPFAKLSLPAAVQLAQSGTTEMPLPPQP